MAQSAEQGKASFEGTKSAEGRYEANIYSQY